jgi:hypothetical protein
MVAAFLRRGDKPMVMRPLIAENQKNGPRKIDMWPVYEVPQRDQTSPYGEDSGNVIADMVSVLSGKEHGSTAEALSFLRQIYPRYPLTLRLAAIVAHSKMRPQFATERPIAQ